MLKLDVLVDGHLRRVGVFLSVLIVSDVYIIEKFIQNLVNASYFTRG